MPKENGDGSENKNGRDREELDGSAGHEPIIPEPLEDGERAELIAHKGL